MESEGEHAEYEKKKKTKFFRFSGGGFKYNLQVAAFLLPCLICFFAFGGQLTITTVIIGLLFVYFFDLVNQPYAVFGCVWFFTLIVEFGLLYHGVGLLRTSIFNIFSLTIIALFCLIMAVWITVQFKWIRNLSEESMMILERILIGMTPIISSAVLTYAGVQLTSIQLGSLLLFIFLSLSYYQLGVPLEASFKSKIPELHKPYACGKLEAAVNTIMFFTFPTLYHIAIYHRAIFSFQHIVAILFFLSSSIVIIRYLNGKYNALWFLGASPLVKKLDSTLLFISFITLVFCFEYRVFFVSFYYSLPFYPPFNYIIVTVAVYSLTGAALLVILGYAKSVPMEIAMVIAAIAAISTTVSLSLTFFCYIFSVAAAVSITHFYYKRSLTSYFIFIFSITICLVFFVRKNYWFIDYHFGGVLDVSLQELCIMLVGTFLFSMLLPGLCLQKSFGGLVIVLHALNLLRVECILYGRNQEMYPGYMLFITGGLGLKMTQHLHKEGYISSVSAWLAYCTHISKFALFISDEAMAVLSLLFLTLSTLSVFFVYPNYKMQPYQAGIQFAATGAAVIFSRSSIITEILMEILNMRTPSNIVIICSMILLWALLNLPLAITIFPNVPIIKSSLFTIIIGVLAFFLFQPEMGLFSSINSPINSSHSLFILIIIILTLVCWRSKSIYVRTFYSGVVGICLGIFIVITSLNTASMIFYVLFSIACILALFFVLFSISPSPKITPYLGYVYIAFELLFPIMMILSRYGNPAGSYGARRIIAVTSVRLATLIFYAGVNLFIALISKSLITSADRNTPLSKSISLICNFSTIFGVVSAFIANLVYLKGSVHSLIVLSPLLLLLTKDPIIFTGLKKENRYLPIIFTYTIGFTLIALGEIWIGEYLLIRKYSFTLFLQSIFHTLLVLCALPSHYNFNRFLYNFQKQSQFMWIIITPLNIVSFFAGVTSGTILGVLGILFAISQFLISHQIQTPRKNTI